MQRAARKPRLTKSQVHDFLDWLYSKPEEFRTNSTAGLIKQLCLKEMNIDVSRPFVKRNVDLWLKIDDEYYRKDHPYTYEHLLNKK